ncbi:MAG: hypothetical protein IPN80_10050 [Flavobacterium sp.]|nr:hypothetical protein [Flavobacterium sp.]
MASMTVLGIKTYSKWTCSTSFADFSGGERVFSTALVSTSQSGDLNRIWKLHQHVRYYSTAFGHRNNAFSFGEVVVGIGATTYASKCQWRYTIVQPMPPTDC